MIPLKQLITKTLIDSAIVYTVLKPMIFKGALSIAKQVGPVIYASLCINIFMNLEFDKALIFLIAAYFVAAAIGNKFFQKK